MENDLLKQIRKISTEYAELLDRRLHRAKEADTIDQEEFQCISDGIRILHQCVVMQETAARLHAGGDADGMADL